MNSYIGIQVSQVSFAVADHGGRDLGHPRMVQNPTVSD